MTVDQTTWPRWTERHPLQGALNSSTTRRRDRGYIRISRSVRDFTRPSVRNHIRIHEHSYI